MTKIAIIAKKADDTKTNYTALIVEDGGQFYLHLLDSTFHYVERYVEQTAQAVVDVMVEDLENNKNEMVIDISIIPDDPTIANMINSMRANP